MKTQFDTVARLQRPDGGEYWIAEGVETDDDGNTVRRRHTFPLETLEWRAAEYGIDPTDTATLVDVVLTEPLLSEEDWLVGTALHNAPDIDTARTDHLARCARAKWRQRLSTRHTSSPCQRIADESPMNLEAVELKRQLVDKIRARATEQPTAPAPDRLQALRAAVEEAT